MVPKTPKKQVTEMTLKTPLSEFNQKIDVISNNSIHSIDNKFGNTSNISYKSEQS